MNNPIKVLRILEGDMLHNKVSQVPLRHAHTWPHSELAQSTPRPMRRPTSSDSKSKMSATSRSFEILGDVYDGEIQSDNPLISNMNENLVSEEYQAYLQGSLAQFIHKMTSSNRDEMTMVN